MAEGKFVCYYRVSTQRQGRSGLGLEAQKAAVQSFLNGGNWQVVSEFVEIESGKRNDRPKLAEALQACRLYGARLIIAKIDRLSRNAAFLLGLRDAGVDFVAADDPHMHPLTVGFRALLAQDEAEKISTRTKEALAAAKARGTVLGGDRGGRTTKAIRKAGIAAIKAKASARSADVLPAIQDLQSKGVIGLREIARQLTQMGIPTARGSANWTPTAVSRVIASAS